MFLQNHVQHKKGLKTEFYYQVFLFPMQTTEAAMLIIYNVKQSSTCIATQIDPTHILFCPGHSPT